MASRSKAKVKETKPVPTPVEPKEASVPSVPVTLEYASRFIHGSTDSRDLDLVYILAPDAPFPSQPTLVAFCKHDEEDRNVIQLARENGDTGDWFVKRSFRGAPDEVNNAVLETHRNMPNDPPYQLGISSKCCRSVILRYIVATKAIIIKMRRIDSCRNDCVEALRKWHFSTNMSTVHGSCRASFADLDQESAKYVTFHLAQSYALALGVELYSKRSLVSFLPEIAPLLYFDGALDLSVPQKHVEVMRDLENRWYALAERIVAKPFGSEKYVQSFHLSGPLIANNYLEADCVGTIIDIQTERIEALGVQISFATLTASSDFLPPGSPAAVQYPPSWPFDNATSEGDKPNASADRWFTIGTQDGRVVACEHSPSLTSESARTGSKTKEAKGRASGKSKAGATPHCGITVPQVAELVNRLSSASFAQYLDIMSFAARVRGEVVVEVTARSLLSLRPMKLPPGLDLPI